MPFMYPEQLRELRAQYPNTQFDGRGRVIGGTPLDQYNTQQANPAAIPASVRTYSQFDPATNTWVRHTNGDTVPAQSPAQTQAASQGVPVNFNEWLGYTPAGFEGATWEMSGGNAQPSQVMRPLPRDTGGRRTTRNTEIIITPRTVNGEQSLAAGNTGMTPSGIEFVDGQPVSLDRTQNIPSEYDGEIRNLNNVPTSTGVVGQPVVNVDPADIGQSVPIREATPRLNLNGYTPPTPGEANWGRALGGAATAVAIPAITGAALMYGPALAGSALNLGRTALTGGLGAATKVLPKNMTSKVSSWANSAVDASKNLFNRLGGFLQRPAPTVQTYTKVRPVHNMVNPNVRRSANYYGH